MTDAAQTETLIAKLRAFPQFYSTDGGIHWLKTANKESLTQDAADEIAKLSESLRAMTAERDAAKEDASDAWHSQAEWQLRAETAERELEACRLDAERYKFLRAFMLMADDEAGAQITLLNSTNGEPETPAEVDAAIDAARQAGA